MQYPYVTTDHNLFNKILVYKDYIKTNNTYIIDLQVRSCRTKRILGQFATSHGIHNSTLQSPNLGSLSLPRAQKDRERNPLEETYSKAACSHCKEGSVTHNFCLILVFRTEHKQLAANYTEPPVTFGSERFHKPSLATQNRTTPAISFKLF